jgi:valyl-tRNA synthetase
MKGLNNMPELAKKYDHISVEKGKYNKWKEKGYFKADNT